MLKGVPSRAAVKNPPADAGEARDVGSNLGSGRSPGIGSGKLHQYSCLGHPWTEEPGGLQSMGSQRVRHDRVTVHACTPTASAFFICADVFWLGKSETNP